MSDIAFSQQSVYLRRGGAGDAPQAAAASGRFDSHEAALWASMALLIIAFVPIALGGEALEVSLNPQRVFEMGVLLLSLVTIIAYAMLRMISDIYLLTPASVIMGLFIYWALLSSLWSPNPVLTLAKAGELAIVALVAVMVVSVAARRPSSLERLANILAWVFILVVGALLVSNLVLYGTLIPMRSALVDGVIPVGEIGAETVRPRFVLGYLNPLATADWLAMAVIILIASRLNLWLKLLLTPGYWALRWLTDGRGPMAGALVAVPAILLLRVRRHDLRVLLAGGAISIFLLAYALYSKSDLVKLVDQLWTPDMSTLNGRTGVWEVAISAIPQRLFTGYGYFASRYVLLQVFSWAGHTHNSFIEIALSTGLVGLFLLTAFVVYMLYAVIVTRDRLLLGMGIYCCIQGMLNPLLFSPGIPMFILLLCMIRAGRRTRRQALAHSCGS